MSYRVTWARAAEDDLAKVWLSAPDKARLSQAANQIDALLAADPIRHGRPHGRSRRAVFVPPLGVIYEIVDAHQTARVLSVWYVAPYMTNGRP